MAILFIEGRFVSSGFSWSCHSYSRLPTNGRRRLVFSLSFIERFFVRPSRQPIADEREARNAAIPNSQITDSPYFHRHSLWELLLGCQLGVLNLETGAAVSEPN